MNNNPEQAKTINRGMRLAIIVGLLAAGLSVVGLLVSGAQLFFQAYLFAFLFWLGISLGCLAFLMLHFVTGSRWGLAVRRVTEAAAGGVWVMALLFIPLLFGLSTLYPWAVPGSIETEGPMAFKSMYLSPPFFIGRAVVYFLVWGGLALLANRTGSQTLADGTRARRQGLGAVGLILYGVTMSFAAVDWMMSLQPFWNSSVYGMLTVIGQVLTGLSFAVVMLNLLPGLSLGRRWSASTTPIPFRDLGALLMTLVMGWAYLAYFQMLIIWAADLPREVTWYLARTEGGWSILAILIVLLQFVLPFLILLSGRARHNLRILAGLGIVLLLANLANLFWQVKPAFFPGQFSVSWLDIVLPLAIGGIWMAAFLALLQRRPVLSRPERVSIGLSEEETLPLIQEGHTS